MMGYLLIQVHTDCEDSRADEQEITIELPLESEKVALNGNSAELR
jgi:hypothetical protein